jgi:hypothetical protein
MAHISVTEANAWTEPTKLTLASIDANIETQIINLIFPRFKTAGFPTTSWTNEASTPALIRTIIAMHYVAWQYDKHYAQEEEASAYAALLRVQADANIASLLTGDITLDEFVLPLDPGTPTFFPNDLSSSLEPTIDTPSDGGPSFMMGTVF